MPNYTSDNKVFKKDMVIKQVNVLPQINYLYFINKEYFYNIFFKKKYILLFEQKNMTDNVDFSNFKNLLKTTQYTDVLFEKNDS